MSRHHMLPPIVYTPAPPKPRKTERRRGVGYSEETGETEEAAAAGDASHTAPAPRTSALPQHSRPVEATERRIPSTTGKLSDGTLKTMLEVQEQQGAESLGPDAKK